MQRELQLREQLGFRLQERPVPKGLLQRQELLRRNHLQELGWQEPQQELLVLVRGCWQLARSP